MFLFVHLHLCLHGRRAQALKQAVDSCEMALKRISDELMQPTSDAAGKDDDAAETESSPLPTNNETDRVLRGVVRVGPLGESLLLRGEHLAQLVLVCSVWPTVELVTFLSKELAKVLPVCLWGWVVSHLIKSNGNGLIGIRLIAVRCNWLTPTSAAAAVSFLDQCSARRV